MVSTTDTWWNILVFNNTK